MKICATVLEPTTDAVLARMSKVAPSCDLIEVRADAIEGAIDLAAIVSRRPRPLVVTCRARDEGGLWKGSESDRLDVLRRAAALGAEHVDVEAASARALGPVPAKLVVSRHVFDGPFPSDLDALFAELAAVKADVQKLAVPVADARDAILFLERAAREARPTIAIGMGFPGVATRLLGGRAGAPWSYAAADRPAAPGQLALETMSAFLRGRRVTRATKALGVIGKPVAHSRSPRVWNACLGALGIDAVYSWLETDDPEGLLAAAKRDAGWAGFSVTIPHKERAARACDRLEGAARAIGAANTVARSSDGAWVGHNTDAPAAAQVLGRAVEAAGASLKDLPVDLLGAGGAARACAWAIREAGAKVTVWNRSEERGRALARELGLDFGGSLADVRATGKPRAVVNATSVGMSSADSPVTETPFDAKTVAFDLVYVPEKTRFLELAAARGAATVSGVEHFGLQAWLQLEKLLGPHVARRITPEWLAARAREERP
jgi:3-dehydroquinate dehydratase/shikimate dehydrogenase